MKIVLEDSVFNSEIHDQMKSVSKMKFINIGLLLSQLIFAELANTDLTDLKIKALSDLMLKNHSSRSMVVRNVQMPKNQVHESAKLVKVEIVKIVEQLKSSPTKAARDLSFQLLKSIFGPNSFTHFSARKNQDLLHPISSLLSSD